MNPHEKHRFIEKNKAKILQDLRELGREMTKQKWAISESGLYGILKRWEANASKDIPPSSVKQENEKPKRPPTPVSERLCPGCNAPNPTDTFICIKCGSYFGRI